MKNLSKKKLFVCVIAIGFCCLNAKNVLAQGAPWQPSGQNIVYTKRDLVGINTSQPAKSLDVKSIHEVSGPPQEAFSHNGVRIQHHIV
ncbi:MAG: hypothetical protein IIA88_08820, partial [Bacteroidetes bacterium]|nr:hypothetical protein [Bacteroidota bacterium]